MSNSDTAMSDFPNLRGRPRGAKTTEPVVPVNTARYCMDEILKRARQGQPEDQRIVVQFIANRGVQ